MKFQQKALLVIALLASLAVAKEDTLIATHDVSICSDNINGEIVDLDMANSNLDQQNLDEDADRFAVLHYTC